MNDFIILSDSTCELSKETLKDFDIVCLNAHFKDKDGTDKVSFSDWSDCDYYTSQEFYKELKNNPSSFSTAAPSTVEIKDAYRKYLSEGKDILVLSLSSVMSGTFNLYTLAKNEILQEFPNAKIEIVDTLRFGGGIGVILVNASILRSEGKTIDEIASFVKENITSFHQMGWLDDLSFVAKKGRITHAAAFFGQLIGIKPLGESDQNGLTTILGKAKGEKNAYNAILEYIEKTIINPSEQVILVNHTVRLKQAQELKRLIIEKFNPKNVYINECGPSVGINCGPGLMCAYYMGTKASENLVKEKELMESILSK